MANNSARVRAKTDGRAVAIESAPSVDGTQVENELLLNLPSGECEVIFPELTFLPLRTHDILHEPGEAIKFGYFMNSGLASVLNVMADGKSVEVGLTGREGFVGLPLIVGLSSSPNRTVIQIAGSAFRIRAADFMNALRRCPTLNKRLQRFEQILAMQGTQVAACNRLHEVDQRLARWLLMSQDRIGSATVPLTQEFLGHMLGTRRSSVTVSAGRLQKAGLITYHRGAVQIENRPGLLRAACECYQSMERQTRRWQSESQ
jgi:CRP-like cAMP-binding protein